MTETMTFDPILEAGLISTRLRELSPVPVDPAPIIRTELPFYGVRVADLRRMARDWHRRHPDAEGRGVAALADRLWERAVREEMVVAAILHGHDPRSRAPFGLRRADRWLRLVDNWEAADALGIWLTARAVGDDPASRYPMLETLAGRRNPWARRVGLVGCLGTARAEEWAARWWPRASAIVLRLSSCRDAGIPKAISWVLREHTRHTAAEVAAFIGRHASDLPAIAVRETRHKLDTGTKTGRG